MKQYTVAVVGATGVVGREMIKTLEYRNFPVGKLVLLASERSAGEKISFHGQSVKVEVLKPESFEGVDFALFSAIKNSITVSLLNGLGEFCFIYELPL